MNIEFILYESQAKEYPKPYPIKNIVPESYKNIKVDVQNGVGNIKDCIPFLEAMTLGYVIPFPYDIEIRICENNSIEVYGDGVGYVKTHSQRQVQGSQYEGFTVLKFINLWKIKTEPGWSCLFTAPMNRKPDLPFKVISGVVDTDVYDSCIHFPASLFNMQPGVNFTISKGYPYVQVIPFKREEITSSYRLATDNDTNLREDAICKKMQDKDYYRTEIKQKKIFK